MKGGAAGRETGCVSPAAFQDSRKSVQGRSVFLLSHGKLTKESFIENRAPQAPFLFPFHLFIFFFVLSLCHKSRQHFISDRFHQPITLVSSDK